MYCFGQTTRERRMRRRRLAFSCLLLSFVFDGVSATACPLGQYYRDDNHSCVVCEPGFFCGGYGRARLPCPANTHTGPNASEIADCQCDTGFYRAEGELSCRVCDSGFFCQNGTRTACPWLQTSPTASGTESDCACVPGAWLAGTSCSLCPKDWFCEGMHLPPSPCPENAHSLPGASFLHQCRCTLPFVMVPVMAQFSCVYAADDSIVALSQSREFPETLVLDSKTTVAIDVDTLTETQKQAVRVDDTLSCVTRSGLVQRCMSKIEAVMLNSTHALLSMQVRFSFASVLFLSSLPHGIRTGVSAAAPIHKHLISLSVLLLSRLRQ